MKVMIFQYSMKTIISLYKNHSFATLIILRIIEFINKVSNFRMASSLSVLQESNSTNTDPGFNGERRYRSGEDISSIHFHCFFHSDVTSQELPLGQYFVYKLISTQKDFGYRKLLRTDLIAEVSFKQEKVNQFNNFRLKTYY